MTTDASEEERKARAAQEILAQIAVDRHNNRSSDALVRLMIAGSMLLGFAVAMGWVK